MENVTMTYIDYEDLRKDPIFPNSPMKFIGSIIKGSWTNFKKSLPKSLIIPIILFLVIGVFNTFFLAVIVDTFYFHTGADSFINKIIIYLVPGIVGGSSGLPGFSHLKNDINTLSVVMPMLFILSFLLRDGFSTLISKEKRKKVFKDLSNLNKNKKIYIGLSDKEKGAQYLKGMIIAFIIGLLVKNPFTIFLLAILFFLSFIKNNGSNTIIFIGTMLASRNIKKGKRDFINFGNIALIILGISYGFIVYFALTSLLFIFLNYHIIARIVFTVIFVVAFIMLLMKNKGKTTKIVTVLLLFIVIAVVLSFNITLYADDGGWSESGANFFDWLANAGTKIIAALGFTGSISAAIGWATNLIIGNAAGFFGVGPILQMGGLLAGFGHPAGSKAANMSFAKAAISSVFGVVGLGDILGGMVSDIESGLSGGGSGAGGDSFDSSGSSSSGNSGSGGKGPIKDLGDEYRKKSGDQNIDD